MAIYAKENGRGMVFSEEDELGDSGAADQSIQSASSATTTTSSKQGNKPKLTVIK